MTAGVTPNQASRRMAASLIAMVVLCGSSVMASAASDRTPAAAPSESAISLSWLPGGTPVGQAGIHRLLYGHAAASSGLTFAAGVDGTYATRLFFDGSQDRLWLSRQTLTVLWTLGAMLEVGLGATSAVGNDAVFGSALVTSVLPALHLKYNLGVWRHWAGGVTASWQAPPLSGSSGVLSPADSTYSAKALVSRGLYRRHGRALELTINLGYIYDRPAHRGSTTVTNPVQLFADGRNQGSRISFGVGLAGLGRMPWPHYELGPYVELTSEWAIKATRVADNPVRLTLGSKIFFDAARRLELDAGVDVRLLGAPRNGSPYAGLSPWALFVALSYHSRLAALDVGAQQVIYVPTVIHDKPRPTFIISGYVRDANALVLEDARLSLSNDVNTRLSVDANTGYYQTMPLPVPVLNQAANAPGRLPLSTTAPLAAAVAAETAAVEVVCEAPGYLSQRQTIVPPQGGSAVRLDFHLQRKPPSALLQLRVFDAADGTPPAGAQALLSGTSEAEDTHFDIVGGELRATLRPGHYTLIVTAPNYQPQRSTLKLNDASELIAHVALRRKAVPTAH